MSESVRTRVGSRIYLSVCLNWSIAYALRWRVNPFRVIPLLGDSSPCRGNFFSGTGVLKKTALLRD